MRATTEFSSRFRPHLRKLSTRVWLCRADLVTSEVEKLKESFRGGGQDEDEVLSWLNHKPALASLWGKAGELPVVHLTR